MTASFALLQHPAAPIAESVRLWDGAGSETEAPQIIQPVLAMITTTEISTVRGEPQARLEFGSVKSP
jgi:hypothetical protein